MTIKQIRNYIIAFGVVVLGLVALAFYTSRILNSSLDITVEVISLQDVVQAVDEIRTALEEERIAIGQYQLSGDAELQSRIAASQIKYHDNWQVIVAYRGDVQAEQIAQIEEARLVYRNMLDEVILAYQANPSDNKSSKILSEAITYYLQNLDPQLSRFADPEIKKLSEQVAIQKVRAANLARLTQGATILGILVSGAAIVMTGLAVFGTQRMVKAVDEIVNAANSISRGDLDVPINVEQRGEIGDLAKAIERMRTSLKAAIERLRR
jgi:HAMP domain-containing protein